MTTSNAQLAAALRAAADKPANEPLMDLLDEAAARLTLAEPRDPLPPSTRHMNGAAVPLDEPTVLDAFSMSGVLHHFVASQPDLVTRLCRWVEHCPGDMDEATAIWYLARTHYLIEPGCQFRVDEEPRPAGEHRGGGDHAH
jgi:hypothetical protein